MKSLTILFENDEEIELLDVINIHISTNGADVVEYVNIVVVKPIEDDEPLMRTIKHYEVIIDADVTS